MVLACVESPYMEVDGVSVFGRRCCWRRRVALKSGVEADDIILTGRRERKKLHAKFPTS